MTVIDRLRSARPGSSRPDAAADDPPTPGRLIAAGAVTALASLAVAWLLALVGWLASGQSTVGLLTTLGIGTDGWLLAHGGRIEVGQAHIAVTPLLAWAGIALLVARRARRLVDTVDGDGQRWRGWLPIGLAAAVGRFGLGYALVAALAWTTTLATPARPALLWTVPAVLLTVLVGVGVGSVGTVRAGPGTTDRLVRLPVSLRRGLPVAGFGAAVLLAAGSLVVLVAVVASLGDVAHVSSELAPGLLGGLVLAGAQLSALPNLALWVVSFCAGPGFHVVDGQSITWSGAHSGLLPMIPALAALPSPGAFPWVVRGLVLAPVVVGVLVGRRAVGSVARLSRMRTKVAVAAWAALGSAVLLGLLDVVAGGALGAYRLSDVGAPAPLLMAFLVVEIGGGAMAAVLWDGWRQRRRRG